MKEEFIEVSVEVVEFDAEDIITTSPSNPNPCVNMGPGMGF